jgi:hypothetical protein
MKPTVLPVTCFPIQFWGRSAKKRKMIPNDTLCHVFWQESGMTRKLTQGIKRYQRVSKVTESDILSYKHDRKNALYFI